MDYEGRLAAARTRMRELGIDALFLVPSGDMEYLTGIRRQRPNATESHAPGDWLQGALVTERRCLLLVPWMPSSFFMKQAQDKPWIDEVIVIPEDVDFHEFARRILGGCGLGESTVALPRKAMAQTILELAQVFPAMRFQCSALVTAGMRMIKDSEEIERMRKAAKLVDEVFAEVLETAKPGMSELDLAHEIDYRMAKRGAEGSSFVTGVMCKNSASPPEIEGVGRAGGQRLEPGSIVALDFGAVVDGYCSDFGRTFYVDEPPQIARKLHELVMTAQAVATEQMKSGRVTASQADRAARSIITEAGFGKEFFHRLGHGIGIDVHEPPFLASTDSTLLQAGMTFTVEPSVLVEGLGFIRVEDVVLVTESGGVPLNEASREILVV